MRNFKYIIVISCFFFVLTGCTALKFTGRTASTLGKFAFATAKTTGKVVGKAVIVTGRGIKTMVNMARGKHIVKLTKKGDTLLVDTILNRRVNTKLILDTGCTNTQISRDVAKRLGLKIERGKKVLCQLADGRQVSGSEVYLKEVRVGRIKVYNVRAIVLDNDSLSESGLLGMSFLNNFIFKVDSEKGELILEKRPS